MIYLLQHAEQLRLSKPLVFFLKSVLSNRNNAAVLTCRVGELLLSDLLQLEDLLQSLRDLGPTDADLLALPHLEQKQKKLCD